MTDEELLALWRSGDLRVTQLTAEQHRLILDRFDDEEN